MGSSTSLTCGRAVATPASIPTGTAGGGGGAGWVATVLGKSPTNFWSFDETDTADPAVDRTGNDDGSYEDSPTLGTAANQGTAMTASDFTGLGRRMEVSAKSDTAFTIICFFNLSDNTPALQFMYTATNDDGVTGFSLIIDDGEVRGFVAGGNVTHTGVVPTGEWHMAAFRWDDSTGDRIVNYDLATTSNNTASNIAPTGTVSQFSSQVKSTSRSARWLRGSIDEAVYFNSSISDSDLEDIYNAYFGI